MEKFDWKLIEKHSDKVFKIVGALLLDYLAKITHLESQVAQLGAPIEMPFQTRYGSLPWEKIKQKPDIIWKVPGKFLLEWRALVTKLQT
ncbi:MAG TPA: hypothetical protein VKM55_22485 [Candidatus Lokiarchaeia archaeon]|nr:hypothetical protein [Candidatus Lokiarchaeia archaeon]